MRQLKRFDWGDCGMRQMVEGKYVGFDEVSRFIDECNNEVTAAVLERDALRLELARITERVEEVKAGVAQLVGLIIAK